MGYFNGKKMIGFNFANAAELLQALNGILPGFEERIEELERDVEELQESGGGGGGTGSDCGIKYRKLELTYEDVDNYCLPFARSFYTYPHGAYLLEWDYGDNPRYGFLIRDDWYATVRAHLYCDGQVYYCEEVFFDDSEEWTFGDWQKITYSKDEIDNKFGDVDTALDELHNYAQALIGGDA